MRISIIIFLLTALLQHHVCKSYYEQNIYKDVLDPDKYDPRSPPQTYDDLGNLRTNITLQMEVYGLQYIDTENNCISFKLAVRQIWQDPRLTWNASNYGGIDTIWLRSNLDPAQVWTPDTNVREDAGEGYFSNLKYTQVRVKSDGFHYWSRIGEMKVVTNFNYEKYPFDTQEVNMTIGSVVYNNKRLLYQVANPPLIIQDPNYWKVENNEWNFINSSVRPVLINISAATTRTFYEFRVTLKRDGGTMLVGLIIPGCLVAGLGSLYYLLERGSGNRISYLATCLLTEIMFLAMLTEIVPQCKNVPHIAFLFLQQTIMLAALSAVVLLLDKVQFQRNLKKKLIIKEMKKKAATLKSERKQSHRGPKFIFGIHSGMSHNDIDSQFQQLLEEEANIKQEIKSAENGIDRCMNIADLIIWIVNVSLYLTFTIKSLIMILN